MESCVLFSKSIVVDSNKSVLTTVLLGWGAGVA